MLKAEEALGQTPEERRAERRRRAVTGPLPESFLRIPGREEEEDGEEQRDRQMALQLQREMVLEARPAAGGQPRQNMMGRMTVTIVEARLNKNYGVTRMDPYARLRIGHNVYETPTCPNGAKEPKWNKTVNCFVIAGTRSLDIEIYDECTFSTDSLIAHTSVPFTDSMLGAEMVDDWWPLSGQEGEEREGMIHLVLSFQKVPAGAVPVPAPEGRIAPNVSGGKPLAYTTSYLPHQPAPPPTISPEDLEEFSKMFPEIEKSVIEAVFVESRGSKEATVNALLQLGS